MSTDVAKLLTELCWVTKLELLAARLTNIYAVQGQNGSDLRPDINKYRQSIFKLNCKIKKSKTNCKACRKISVSQNAAYRVLARQALDPCAEAA